MSLPASIGRYTVQRVLGRGGMGTVYLAVDPLIQREVAVKVLPLAGVDEYADRLIAEARVSGRLIHPNIVGVFDVGEEHGQPFVVMPYVPGRTVASILTDPGRPPIGTKLRWMAQLCDALAYAHERRVIHRDIKPTNLLIDEQQNLRVLDFGIAKVLTTSQIQFTSVGTPAYMAPEQYSSDPVDPRTDVFAAGLVFYELITHRRALTGTTPAQIYGQLMAGQLPRVLDAAPDTDPALAAVCERAMSRDPNDRFQTARAFGDALADVHQRRVAATIAAPIAEREPPISTTVPSKPQGPSAPGPDPAPTLATRIDAAAIAPPAAAPVEPVEMFRTPAPAASQAMWAWAVLALAAIAVMCGVFWLSRSGPGRIQVASDLQGTTFWLRPLAGVAAVRLASNQASVDAGRYEIGGDYIDGDPLLGDPHGTPTTVRQNIDVVAGQATNVNLKMEPTLWRDRFERAVEKPVGPGRAALLEQTYRRLRQMGALDAVDTARYQQAASQQQLVKFVNRTIATDMGTGGAATYQRFDIVRIDGKPERIALVGSAPPGEELARGRHNFAAVVDVLHPSGRQSMTCSGGFDVAGGPSALELPVDAIVRRPRTSGGKLTVECQVGAPAPFAPSPAPTARPESATLTVRVQSGGRPLIGATIVLAYASDPIPQSLATGVNGTATFSGLRSGDYRLTARQGGYRAFTSVVKVAATANLYAVQLDARLAQTTTDEHGRFRINVNPGRFDVFVTGAGTRGGFFEGVSVTTSRGAQLEATLTTPTHPGANRFTGRGSDDGGTMSGLFVDDHGAPLAGVSINIYPARTNVGSPTR
jgi:hypothetical protein